MLTFKKEILVILTIALSNCTEVMYLKDGRTMVPRKKEFYKKSKNFDRAFLNGIDTTSVYKEIVALRKDYIKPLRTSFKNKYGIYRFYGNGCFNLFYSEINDTNFNAQDFDPNYTGWRGKLYSVYDDLFGKLFIESELDSANYVIHKCLFWYTKDTLFVNVADKYQRVYLRQKVSDSLLKNGANW